MNAHSARNPVADVDTRDAIGQHLIADLWGIVPQLLQDDVGLLELFSRALADAGCHILHRQCHRFPGLDAGVTGMIMLSESHAAFHTYPEHGYMALDLFVCGDVSPPSILQAIREPLNAARCDWRIVPRGVAERT